MSERRQSRQVRAGSLLIGGGAPVSVQTMTNVPLSDAEATVRQIRRLHGAGAALIRLAVRTPDEAALLPVVRRETAGIVLCADIHFDYRLALAAIEHGIDKIRLNPGNIGAEERVRAVVSAARERNVPIRIGVNGGSLDKKRYPVLSARALVDSALEHVRILEDLDFHDIVVSLKASDVFLTIAANRLLAEQCPYPIHVGLTEAGYGLSCLVHSSLAIGTLLLEGIGDTIRISMTGDPAEEITAGYELLRAAGLLKHGLRVISCPTCGRTDPTIDLLEIAREVDQALGAAFGAILAERQLPLTVAVMGCEVNGPGEAAHADFGIAGARSGNFLLFASGTHIAKIPRKDIVPRLEALVREWLSAQSGI